MALGVTPLRVGQEAYWLDQIARDRCEYYAGKGESAGGWAAWPTAPASGAWHQRRRSIGCSPAKTQSPASSGCRPSGEVTRGRSFPPAH